MFILHICWIVRLPLDTLHTYFLFGKIQKAQTREIQTFCCSSLTWCLIICRSTFGCSRDSLQMDFLTLWSVASLRRAAACCVVRPVGAARAPQQAPPQAVYVNHIIMLFRSIDRPARRALPVWGQEPWGWRVTFAQHGGAGRPVGPGGDLSSWRAGVVVLTPAAPRWASELWPFPLASLSDGGRLTRSPKPPGCPQTSLPSSSAAVRRSDITPTYSPNPNSPARRLKTRCSNTEDLSEEQTDLSDLYCKISTKNGK